MGGGQALVASLSLKQAAWSGDWPDCLRKSGIVLQPAALLAVASAVQPLKVSSCTSFTPAKLRTASRA